MSQIQTTDEMFGGCKTFQQLEIIQVKSVMKHSGGHVQVYKSRAIIEICTVLHLLDYSVAFVGLSDWL